MLHRLPVVAVFLALLACPASAVLIDSGDGTGNISPPRDDPGFANVGSRGGLSAIYLGNGWVLTANHVGAGPVVFESVVYQPVPGAQRRLRNANGKPADLLLFGIAPEPNLPALEIRSSRSLPDVVTLVGQGRDRGVASDSDDPLVWTAPPEPPSTAIEGYLLEGTRAFRWGTNRVDGHWPDPNEVGDTVAYVMDFDEPGPFGGYTTDESQAVNGDSGGALFAKKSGSWELAGVMYMQGLYIGQQSSSVLYGNLSFVADLSVYRDEIEAVTALPEPAAVLQLGAGAGLLAGLQRRRSRLRVRHG